MATPLDVLECDRHVLVINKPPGLLSQADRTGDPDVLSLAREHIDAAKKDGGKARLVHRLDRPASGVMVLARSSNAARNLSRQFREHTIEKRYLALVEGRVTGIGQCVDYLLKENQQVRVVSADHPDGKRAELSWQSVAQSGGLSLLQVQLQTGRPHQIRVQLSERGHPICGDLRYGATRELDGQNLALHSFYLAVEHPVEHVGCSWAAAPPDAWGDVLDDALRQGIERLLAPYQR
jgi:tRNA pseudouridine32 synthase/23S rRNA pseudouridine746 synthase/23S rRNA pseudouridine1911/1915/1917 synthase